MIRPKIALLRGGKGVEGDPDDRILLARLETRLLAAHATQNGILLIVLINLLH